MQAFEWRKTVGKKMGCLQSKKVPARSAMEGIDKKDIKSESVRTSTVTKNGVKTVITERTITTHDGRTCTTKEEKSEGASGSGAGKPTLMMNSSGPKPDGGSSGGERAAPVDLKTFRDQSLAAHNSRRAKHGVPPLKLSAELNDYAQKWAEHLVKKGAFEHSNCTLGSKRLGENIANKWASYGADFTGEDATEQWYSEISKYTYKGDSGSPGTGHFTQVVWKGTEELGMGKAQDGKGGVIAVGSYFPAGNFLGKYSENVFPPK